MLIDVYPFIDKQNPFLYTIPVVMFFCEPEIMIKYEDIAKEIPLRLSWKAV